MESLESMDTDGHDDGPATVPKTSSEPSSAWFRHQLLVGTFGESVALRRAQW